MIHVLPRRDFEQVEYEMPQVQYVDLGLGSDPTVLGQPIYNASAIQFGTNQ